MSHISRAIKAEKSGELCKWAIPIVVMIHGFVLNILLSSDTVFGLALNFSVYNIYITCTCSIYSLANCHHYNKIRNYKKSVERKKNESDKVNTWSWKKIIILVCFFFFYNREVHKQEKRSCFISVVTGAESDILTDLSIQVKPCFKQYNQEPLCIT